MKKTPSIIAGLECVLPVKKPEIINEMLAIIDRLWNVCGQMGAALYWPAVLG